MNTKSDRGRDVMVLRAVEVPLPFLDRNEAGRYLAARLAGLSGRHPVVLGIPRGGVSVAAEVAGALGGELDVIVTRKLGAPGHPELAIGAVSADGGRFLNEDVLEALEVSAEYLALETGRQLGVARDRERVLRSGAPAIPLEGRTVILVDDGLATGATMRAAALSVRNRNPTRLIVAVPVGSLEACEALEAVADEVVCLATPEPFGAVGYYYRHFEQVEDAEVARLLRRTAVSP